MSTTDSTVLWINRSLDSTGVVRPNLLLRTATDQNWLLAARTGSSAALPGSSLYRFTTYNRDVAANILMNAGPPGMRISGLTTWSTTETLDQMEHTAQVELINALPISKITSSLTANMPGWYCSNVIVQQVAENSLGVPVLLKYYNQADGQPVYNPNSPTLYTGDITRLIDSTAGYASARFTDEKLMYRIVANEIVQGNFTNWPDPASPPDECDNDDPTLAYWGSTATGGGAYYILIDQEVMRVHYQASNNQLLVAAGGRGVNGVIQPHTAGATIYLLGFPPYTGKWTGMGYLSADDFMPYKTTMRPGVCLASYEGYGDFTPKEPIITNGGKNTGFVGLSKREWGPYNNNNYVFTGYWFIRSQEVSLGEDGVPKLTVDLSSASHALSAQHMTQNIIYRFANELGNWGAAIYDQVGHIRNIPNSWLDYHQWDPSLPGSTSNGLQIFTEFGQHKAFFDHMSQTQNGASCEFCQSEYTTFVSRPGYRIHSNPIGETRAVGRHIYAESIRVFPGKSGSFDPGPVKTFGRLMMALAVAAYETPTQGGPLAQRWTKVPNQLFDNLRNFSAGRVWNGQLTYDFKGDTRLFDWSQVDDVDMPVVNPSGPGSIDPNLQKKRSTLLCPFQANYQNQPWTQPMQDLADMNQMTFSVSRAGFPIFIPKGLKLRGRSGFAPVKDAGAQGISKRGGWLLWGESTTDSSWTGEFHMSWNGSISNYTYNLNVDQVLTQVTVTATTALDSSVSISAAGTYYDIDKNQLFLNSPITGNKAALRMTGGIQTMDTLSLDNISVGLNWDTQPANWGLLVSRNGKDIVVDNKPTIPSGNPILTKKRTGQNKTKVMRLQKTINFMLIRHYIFAIYNPETKTYSSLLNEDGIFGEVTRQGVISIQNFLGQQRVIQGTTSRMTPGSPYFVGSRVGEWTGGLSYALRAWLKDHQEQVKADPWWYVQSGYDWTYYVASVVGLPIPQYEDDENSSGFTDPSTGNIYAIDELALRLNIENWQKQFYYQLINVGNMMVNDTINKAQVRQVQTNIADPRIQLGDVIWLNIPGFLQSTNLVGRNFPPFSHGMYVTDVTRSMDLTSGNYTATYAGYMYQGNFANTPNGSNFEFDKDHFYTDVPVPGAH